MKILRKGLTLALASALMVAGTFVTQIVVDGAQPQAQAISCTYVIKKVNGGWATNTSCPAIQYADRIASKKGGTPYWTYGNVATKGKTSSTYACYTYWFDAKADVYSYVV